MGHSSEMLQFGVSNIQKLKVVRFCSYWARFARLGMGIAKKHWAVQISEKNGFTPIKLLWSLHKIDAYGVYISKQTAPLQPSALNKRNAHT